MFHLVMLVFGGTRFQGDSWDTSPNLRLRSVFRSAPVFHNTWCRWSYLHYEVPLYLKNLYYSFDQFEACWPYGVVLDRLPRSVWSNLWSHHLVEVEIAGLWQGNFWAKVQFQPEKRPVILRWLARGSLNDLAQDMSLSKAGIDGKHSNE